MENGPLNTTIAEDALKEGQGQPTSTVITVLFLVFAAILPVVLILFLFWLAVLIAGGLLPPHKLLFSSNGYVNLVMTGFECRIVCQPGIMRQIWRLYQDKGSAAKMIQCSSCGLLML